MAQNVASVDNIIGGNIGGTVPVVGTAQISRRRLVAKSARADKFRLGFPVALRLARDAVIDSIDARATWSVCAIGAIPKRRRKYAEPTGIWPLSMLPNLALSAESARRTGSNARDPSGIEAEKTRVLFVIA